jgi:hypothetical protein
VNLNFFQTILTVILTICSIATAGLLALGCIESPSGTMLCSAANAPAWLVPYLVLAASIVGPLKLIIAKIEGKLTAPTVVVSTSGDAGTVRPSQVK